MSPAPTAAALEGELRALLATELEVSAEDVDPDARLTDLGVSSVKILRVVAKIENAYGIELDDEVLFSVETLRALAVAMATRIAAA